MGVGRREFRGPGTHAVQGLLKFYNCVLLRRYSAGQFSQHRWQQSANECRKLQQLYSFSDLTIDSVGQAWQVGTSPTNKSLTNTRVADRGHPKVAINKHEHNRLHHIYNASLNKKHKVMGVGCSVHLSFREVSFYVGRSGPVVRGISHAKNQLDLFGCLATQYANVTDTRTGNP